MGHYEDYRQNERIFDNNGRLSPREMGSGSGFVATLFAVAVIALLAWGIGYVEVKPYSSNATISQLPGVPVPTPLPPPVPSVPST